MTRNVFKDDPLEGFTDLQIQDALKRGDCTVDDVRRHRGLPPAEDVPGEGDGEDLSQEVEPIEVDPHMWPSTSLAGFRKVHGLSITQAHIAERYGIEDVELPD